MLDGPSAFGTPTTGVQVRVVVDPDGELQVGMFGTNPDIDRLLDMLDNADFGPVQPNGGVIAMMVGYDDDFGVEWGPGFVNCTNSMGLRQVAQRWELIDAARTYLVMG